MKISIITITYNAEKYIEDTIKSVISQSYKDNIEYIVVDGQSEDNTLNIINKYQSEITTIISEKDQGIYDAMNKGLKYATGDVVAFLNAGDLYIKSGIKRVASYFEDNDIDILVGAAEIICENKKNVSGERRGCNLSWIYYGTPCCHQAIFARRYVFENIADFNIKYKISADYDWMLRVFDSKAKWMCVEEILVKYLGGGVSDKNTLTYLIESKEIALGRAKNKGHEEMLFSIEKHYKTMLKRYVESDYFRSFVLKKNIEYIRKLFENVDNLYIWGYGINGKICEKLMNAADIKISGFIDSNEKVKGGCSKIISPDDINKEMKILISSPTYEEEILKIIKLKGIEGINIYRFSNIRENAKEDTVTEMKNIELGKISDIVFI